MSSQANSCLEVLVAVLTLIRRRDECGSRGAGSDLSLCTLLDGFLIRLPSNTTAPAWMLMRHVERADARHS